MRVLFLMTLALAPVFLAAAADDSRWLAERAEQRKQRQAFTAQWRADERQRAESLAGMMAPLLALAGAQPSPEQAGDLARLRAGLKRLDPERTVAAGTPPTGDPARAWAAALRDIRSKVVQPMERFAQKALEAGVPEVAHAYMLHVLAFDPDHAALHRNLGQTRVGDRWYGPRDMEMVKAGHVWDDTLGWILAKERARYEKGEYYDIQARRWTTLAEADERRADARYAWLVQTEHLEVRGTAKLTDLVGIASRLERFYDRVFAAYAGFFAADPRSQDVRLLFGLAEHPRLIVHVARDKERYQQSLPAGIDPGWSAGMFVSAVPASFFYVGNDTTMYHEFTHQILHIFSGGNRSPTWLTEGVAVYTESPRWVEGDLVLGDLGSRRMREHFRRVREGSHTTLDRLLGFTTGAAWSAVAEPGPNYCAAGALAWFCMHAEDGRWRADYVDFLRDSYRGQTRDRALWHYLGMDRAAFTAAYTAWEGAAAAAAAEGGAPARRPAAPAR